MMSSGRGSLCVAFCVLPGLSCSADFMFVLVMQATSCRRGADCLLTVADWRSARYHHRPLAVRVTVRYVFQATRKVLLNAFAACETYIRTRFPNPDGAFKASCCQALSVGVRGHLFVTKFSGSFAVLQCGTMWKACLRVTFRSRLQATCLWKGWARPGDWQRSLRGR